MLPVQTLSCMILVHDAAAIYSKELKLYTIAKDSPCMGTLPNLFSISLYIAVVIRKHYSIYYTTSNMNNFYT